MSLARAVVVAVVAVMAVVAAGHVVVLATWHVTVAAVVVAVVRLGPDVRTPVLLACSAKSMVLTRATTHRNAAPSPT